MATYVNDLRLKEIATGDEAGTWGTSTNTNLELIAEAFSFGTEAITSNADTHTTTIADGSTDPGRSMFLKYTGALDSDCTVTIGPNTVSKLWFIENATTDSGSSGPYNIIIKQGSGATITVPNGQVKAIYSDGAGSGGAMVDAFQDLSVPDLFVDDDLTFTSDSAVITFGADGDTTLTHTDGSGLTLNSTNKIMFNDASQFIQGSSATVLSLGATDEIDLTATAIDINGTVDMSSTLTVADDVNVDSGTLFVDASTDRVGVGLTSPQANLQVLGTIKVATGNDLGILGLGEASGTTVNAGIFRGAANNPTSGGNFLNLGGYDGIVFAASNAAIGSQSERMRIDGSTGNVTIGSVASGTSSSTPVELNLGSTFADSAGSLSKAKFKLFEDSSANVYGLSVSSGLFEFGVPSSAGYAFFVNESEHMRLTSDGSLGLGTSSPESVLAVKGSSGASDLFSISDVGVPTSGAEYGVAMIKSNATDFALNITAYNANGKGLRVYNNGGQDAFLVTQAGGDRFVVDGSGNVGMGITPAVLLDIKEDTAATDAIIGLTAGTGGRAQIRSEAQSDATSSELSFHTMTGSSTSEAARIDSSGNLLVGGTSDDPAANSNNVVGTAIGASGYLSMTRSGTTVAFFNRKTDDGNIVHFRKDGTNVGVISTEGGDLAIGNDDAGIQFVNGNEHFRPFNVSTNAATDALMDIGSSSKRFKDLFLSGIALITAPAGESKYFNVKDATHGGDVRFGIQTGVNNDGIAGTFTNNDFVFFTNSAERARFAATGQFLIGTSTNFGNLTVRDSTRGSSDVIARFLGASDNSLLIRGDGDAENTNNSYGAISDVRVKENIIDASPKLEDLMRVQVRNYNLIGQTQKQIGVVAQELEQIFPSMIKESPEVDDNGQETGETRKSVKYSVFVPMLIKAIQEQQTTISALEARINQLENA